MPERRQLHTAAPKMQITHCALAICLVWVLEMPLATGRDAGEVSAT